MKLGIRAQLLLALGGLLLLGLVPLFFAVASGARASLARSWEEQARALGRSIAGHVSEARKNRRDEQLAALLEAQIGHGVTAVASYDRTGAQLRSAGAAAELPARVAPEREQVIDRGDGARSRLLVIVPGADGPVAVLLDLDAAPKLAPLVRLVALYTGLLGLGLLVFSYLVLTRLVVSPVEQLSRAARRVADGARELAAPRGGARELTELGASLAQMTAALLAEEQALRRKVNELERATEELKRAQETVVRSERLASVGRLAAGLAHEIGNPITAILSFQELLLDGELEAEQRDFVVRMKRETERVNKVLRDLLDFARPAARAASEEVGGTASVVEAIDHVVALVRPQKSFAHVELITAVEGELPAVGMRADRIEQVLLNLLLNAADAAPKPGGQITIAATSHAHGVDVAVEDNGGGIAPSVRERLFEPFVTTKEVGKGTGLGLAVCRGLVESAGGTIRVEDGGEGARFVLSLPLAGVDS